MRAEAEAGAGAEAAAAAAASAAESAGAAGQGAGAGVPGVSAMLKWRTAASSATLLPLKYADTALWNSSSCLFITFTCDTTRPLSLCVSIIFEDGSTISSIRSPGLARQKK